MGVYIKGMEMPTRCGRCDFRIPAFDDGLFDHYECCITAAIIDNLGEKMEDCHLVPVPPHGRLIDADVLMRHKGDCYDADGQTYTCYWDCSRDDRACMIGAMQDDDLLDFLAVNKDAIAEILNGEEDGEDGLCESDSEVDSTG